MAEICEQAAKQWNESLSIEGWNRVVELRFHRLLNGGKAVVHMIAAAAVSLIMPPCP